MFKLFKSLLFIVFFLTFSANAFAQISSAERQDQIIRQQQEIIDQQNIQKEFNKIKKERNFLERAEELEVLSDEEAVKLGKCFNINSIELMGANLLSKRQQQKIKKPFLNECFNSLTFPKLVESITNYYHLKGYSTVQVIVPKQNISTGDFKLKIIEGKIDDLT